MHRPPDPAPSPSADRPDLAALFEALRPYLLHIAEQEIDPDLRPKGTPSDVVQDTFLIAHRDRGQFHGHSPEELRAWLRAILRCQVARLRRRFRGATHAVRREVPADRLPKGFEPPAALTPPPEELQRREEAERVAGLVGRLPEPQRCIVEGRVGDETFAVIGRRLGMSADAVRMAWNRIRKRLRGQFEGDGQLPASPAG